MKEGKLKKTMEKLKRAKNLYNALKKDEESVFFGNDKTTNQLIKKTKKSVYKKAKVFINFYNNLGDVYIQADEVIIPTYVPFVEKKRDIDRSTLYSFSGPFELLQADIVNISFFAKSVVDPYYCLLFVDLFT